MKTALMLLIVSLLMPSVARCVTEGSQVKQFRNDFETLFHRDTSQFAIRFVNRNPANLPNVMGYCFHAEQVIEIYKPYWDHISPLERQMMLFHEFGHCVAHKDHFGDEFKDGCHASIMNAHLDHELCYLKHYNELLEQFAHP